MNKINCSEQRDEETDFSYLAHQARQPQHGARYYDSDLNETFPEGGFSRMPYLFDSMMAQAAERASLMASLMDMGLLHAPQT